MPSDKKRLSTSAQALLLGFLTVFLLLPACKKKDRLTASTFRFAITPPATSVLKTDSLELVATGSSSGGAVDVNPTWTVSPASIGTLTPEVGTAVVFQPTALGDAIITATYGDMAATSQVAVVSYIPSATSFGVYNDAGLPSGSGIASDIFVGGLTLAELSTGYTPEGVRYQRASNAITGNFWGVTLDRNTTGLSKNLSAFSTLKFALRLGRVVAVGESLVVRVEDTGATFSHTLAPGDGEYNRTNTNWQEISIPVSSGFPGVDSTHVKTPFIIVLQSASSPLTFDIDAVRWSN